MPRRKKKTVEHRIRLYPGQDDKLIRWMESLDDLPWGEKAQRVKDALLRSTDVDRSGEPIAAPAPAAVNLAEIRQVVEASIETALARFDGGQITSTADADEDDEAETWLDGLGASLILDDGDAE